MFLHQLINGKGFFFQFCITPRSPINHKKQGHKSGETHLTTASLNGTGSGPNWDHKLRTACSSIMSHLLFFFPMNILLGIVGKVVLHGPLV